MGKTNRQSSDQKLLAALTRLLEGRPQLSDGRLTKSNVAREAGVSLSTANRSDALHLLWAKEVEGGRARKNPSTSAIEAKLAASRKKGRDLQKKCRYLEERLAAAQMMVAQLYRINIELAGNRPAAALRSPDQLQP